MNICKPIKEFWTGIKKGNIIFGELITNLVNFIVLTTVYVIALIPTAIIAKLVGKHFLDHNQENGSTWKDAEKNKNNESHYRQF